MGVIVRQKLKGKGKPWWVFVSHSGKRTSKLVGDKAAAEDVASKIRAKLQLGEFGFEEKPKIPTLKEYSQVFLNGYSKFNHKRSTQDSYNDALRLHILPVLGDMGLDEITRKHVKDLLYQKQQNGLSPGTVRIIKAYLSSILTQAVDDEIITVNPAARTGRYIKKENGKEEIKPFTWEETTLFEKAIQEHFPRYYPFFLCALRTGMREGELIALKPGDIDFKNRLIDISRNCVRRCVTTPKSGKTRRVDMSNGLADTLSKHLTERKKEALKKGL